MIGEGDFFLNELWRRNRLKRRNQRGENERERVASGSKTDGGEKISVKGKDREIDKAGWCTHVKEGNAITKTRMELYFTES